MTENEAHKEGMREALESEEVTLMREWLYHCAQHIEGCSIQRAYGSCDCGLHERLKAFDALVERMRR